MIKFFTLLFFIISSSYASDFSLNCRSFDGTLKLKIQCSLSENQGHDCIADAVNSYKRFQQSNIPIQVHLNGIGKVYYATENNEISLHELAHGNYMILVDRDGKTGRCEI
jgi:hypothetical protein